MVEFPFTLPHDFLSSAGHVSQTKGYHWVASVVSGVVVCITVYKLTGIISLLCFKGYGKLSNAQKVEWNNRGFSTFHALVVAFVSLYLLLLSDTFDENSRGDLIVTRTSTLSDTLLGVLHHGLSMFSIILALISGQAQFYILMVLFSESTTPFVNLRWYLDIACQKDSNLYIYNGVALFLGWLVARILLFIFFFSHMFIHFDQVKKVFPLGFYSLLVVPPVLATMNLYWFWKISKGLIRTLSKARHSQ
ncbi:TLC domain-containing protein 4-B-like isoform X2 [Juglans regia]|uniref:TLC domain-containing protein 4-B-like isoform X2 n=1 Tax=Juglans regia TaxID=51240 RepID=A0A6P9E025_JUGRE|nr:TLC domain-containing protein 4-B-like isoform X2 [Juglans regia]